MLRGRGRPMMCERATDGSGQQQCENNAGMPEWRDGPPGLRRFACGTVAAEGAHGSLDCRWIRSLLSSHVGHAEQRRSREVEVSAWKKLSSSPQCARLRESFRDRCPVTAQCSWAHWRCAKRCAARASRRSRSTNASWATLSPPGWGKILDARPRWAAGCPRA